MLKITAKGKNAEILLYDDIGEGMFGGISAKAFISELNKAGNLNNIDIRINSAGGDVFEGVAIYNALIRNSARVVTHVDGLAASIASIIAMAGDSIHIADNAMMMIHDPWTFAMGSAVELRKQADTLDKVRDTLIGTYVNRTGLSTNEVSGLMTAETWMDAKEAVSRGFADTVFEPMPMAASIKIKKYNYRHMPERFVPRETSNNNEYRDKITKLANRKI